MFEPAPARSERGGAAWRERKRSRLATPGMGGPHRVETDGRRRAACRYGGGSSRAFARRGRCAAQRSRRWRSRPTMRAERRASIPWLTLYDVAERFRRHGGIEAVIPVTGFARRMAPPAPRTKPRGAPRRLLPNSAIEAGGVARARARFGRGGGLGDGAARAGGGNAGERGCNGSSVRSRRHNRLAAPQAAFAVDAGASW